MAFRVGYAGRREVSRVELSRRRTGGDPTGLLQDRSDEASRLDTPPAPVAPTGRGPASAARGGRTRLNGKAWGNDVDARPAGASVSPVCPVCDATNPRLRYRLTHFSIFRCADCAQVYLWPLPSEEEIRRLFANLYTTGDTMLPELRGYYAYCFDDSPANPLVQTYEHWLGALERHHRPGTILDIGCGTGLFLAVARRRGWVPFGVDESGEATRHARERFGLDVETGDFAAFAAGGRTFDAITMWDIIEHARRPVELLAAVRGSLAPGGVIGLSTPNERSILDLVAGTLYRATGGRVTGPLEKFYIDQHFLYFSPATLEAGLGRAGLGLAELGLESTDLRRLALSLPKRLVLATLFRVGRWMGLDNRLFAVARATA